MNIKFIYLYRDGANYKQYNSIVFANPSGKTLAETDTKIKSHLIDGLWFVADDWNLPNQFFAEYMWSNEVDHNWHQYDRVKETSENVTTGYNIDDFLDLVVKTKLPW